jgi:hypothetical protein
MSTVDLNSDAFAELLAEALRAGPGSPQWHEVISILNVDGDQAHQHRQLLKARQRLQSGRDWRSVRAGPGFTRRLFSRLEESGNASTLSAPGLIAAISICVALIVLGIVAMLLWPTPDAGRTLSNVYLVRPIAHAEFNDELPRGWEMIGSLPLETARGLRPASTSPTDGMTGGALLWSQALDASEPFAVEVRLRAAKPEDSIIVQVFISDRPDYNANAISSIEVVWQLRARSSELLLPDGRLHTTLQRAMTARLDMAIRLAMDRQQMSLEVNGQRLWTGPHQLSADRPRHVGVRFLRQGQAASDAIVVQSLRINGPQQ